MGDLAACGVPFITALSAATVLPFGSEPLFVGLLMAGQQPVWLLVLVAQLTRHQTIRERRIHDFATPQP
jgi:membrane protein YqaA with SNARE-associated domain